jgi:methanogenic corrinoid protein MtbC1
LKPSVVALSGFLTLAYDSMKETVEAIKTAGPRDRVQTMIGGGTVDDKCATMPARTPIGWMRWHSRQLVA